MNPFFDVVYGIPEDKSGLGLVTYAICSNGIFLIRPNACGWIVTKVDGIPGVPEGKERISILPRKIPINLFWETIKFFRYAEEVNQNKTEAYVLVMYNPKEDEFFLHVPKQSLSSARVSFDLQGVWDMFPGCKVLMDIHSHKNKCALI
jgi:hypothetical protein